jgi:hypothetical protein
VSLFVETMHRWISDLAQEIVQLRGHAVMGVADLPAEAAIDQEAECVAIVCGHMVILTS